MPLLIKYTEDAVLDVKEIIEWYKERSPVAAVGFYNNLVATENLILRQPFSFAKTKYKNLYRIIVKKYPYRMYYKVADTELQIIALIHTSRSNKFVKRRLIK